MKIVDNTTYEDIEIKDVKLTKASVRVCEFLDCSFKECSFPEVTFDRCTFNDCKFANCDISLMVPQQSVFRGVEFMNCKLLGINWSKASWFSREVHILIKTMGFRECNLNYSSFTGLELSGLDLVGCAAHEVDFSEANLSKADLRNTDFHKATFRNTNLAGTNLLGAKNYFIDPANNIISKARFWLPEALGLLYAMDIELDAGSDG